jgi:hypothetical protein
VTVVLVRTSRRGLRWPLHSIKMSNGREPRCRLWGPRRNRRQDRALEAAGDRKEGIIIWLFRRLTNPLALALLRFTNCR